MRSLIAEPPRDSSGPRDGDSRAPRDSRPQAVPTARRPAAGSPRSLAVAAGRRGEGRPGRQPRRLRPALRSGPPGGRPGESSSTSRCQRAKALSNRFLALLAGHATETGAGGTVPRTARIEDEAGRAGRGSARTVRSGRRSRRRRRPACPENNTSGPAHSGSRARPTTRPRAAWSVARAVQVRPAPGFRLVHRIVDVAQLVVDPGDFGAQVRSSRPRSRPGACTGRWPAGRRPSTSRSGPIAGGCRPRGDWPRPLCGASRASSPPWSARRS